MSDPTIAERKAALRKQLRRERHKFAAALPREVSALVFSRPPRAVAELVPAGATIGFYRSDPGEAPAAGFIRHFYEQGHRIALPRVTTLREPMRFHEHTDPFGESDLVEGVMGLRQPADDLAELVPQVLFTPLVGFTANGDRLGQGGGFYDRWLAEHPGTIAIGLAWDMQQVDELPVEPHDQRLTRIVTPTRVLGPF